MIRPDKGAVEPSTEASEDSVITPPRNAALIRVSARLGVWGLVLALVPALAEAFWRPLDHGLVGPVSSVGLIISGLGTVVASSLVWRSLPGRLSALKMACVFGVPLGSAFVLAGVAFQRPLGAVADFVDSIGPVVLGLALAAAGLLIWGFVGGRSRG